MSEPKIREFLPTHLGQRGFDVQISSGGHRREALVGVEHIVQTSKKLGVGAYAYLRDRIRRRFELPSLATSIENAAQIAANGLASG